MAVSISTKRAWFPAIRLIPDNFGKQNVGIYRMEVKGKRKLGLQPVPMHDIALHLHKAEERGEICRLPSHSVTIRSSP